MRRDRYPRSRTTGEARRRARDKNSCSTARTSRCGDDSCSMRRRMTAIGLDDLYYMTARIYSEQNASRSAAVTFAHFVEVCGMLTVHDRKKKRESTGVESALCKALGWFFPLMAKFRIKSVEELIFRKYPNVCPYCRKCPHEDQICKAVKGTASTVDHAALKQAYAARVDRKPTSLTDWQRMFADIYPRRAEDAFRSTIGLFEELGELAEAVRVFERFPKYFAGEAADVFSYLMGIANEHLLRMDADTGTPFSFEDAFLRSYPGLCVQCGNRICICPAIPEATVGRLAKELDLVRADEMFAFDFAEGLERGEKASQSVLDRLGGHPGIIESFPVDRGEANRTIMLLYLDLAQDADAAQQTQLGEQLRAAAVRLGSSVETPGSRHHSALPTEELALVRKALDARSSRVRYASPSFAGAVERMVETKRILFVGANPPDTGRLDLAEEERAIRDSISRAKYRDSISITCRHAATLDDLRRAMLETAFTIVHLAGHSDEFGLFFSDAEDTSIQTPMSKLAALFERYPSIECVVVSGCVSLDAETRLARTTVGMTDEVADGATIEFARGFYDAIGAGKNYADAMAEGRAAAELKEYACPVRMNLKG